jgi:hypothetical protein
MEEILTTAWPCLVLPDLDHPTWIPCLDQFAAAKSVGTYVVHAAKSKRLRGLKEISLAEDAAHKRGRRAQNQALLKSERPPKIAAASIRPTGRDFNVPR